MNEFEVAVVSNHFISDGHEVLWKLITIILKGLLAINTLSCIYCNGIWWINSEELGLKHLRFFKTYMFI